MALTRARVVAGDASLAAEIATRSQRRCRASAIPPTVAREVRKMRALIAQEKGDADPWDLKLVAGGLLDIEFVAQYCARLRPRAPEILDVSTRAAIDARGRGAACSRRGMSRR